MTCFFEAGLRLTTCYLIFCLFRSGSVEDGKQDGQG